jgi:hypothetical protein
MRLSQVRAWILLAVPDESNPLSYALGMADGLNKVIPTLDELRESLGWLLAAELISVDAGNYQRSEQGQTLISKCEATDDNAFDLWDKVESLLEAMSIETAVPYELTAEEYENACDEYHQRFREIYKKLKSEDT